jgi:hypothetical protein
MLTLYHSSGACSLAPHIALEETGATYARQLVSIPKSEQQAPEDLNVNPRGKIPALRTDEGVLTENVAILTYIARSLPQARLLPEEPIGMARCISHMAWLSNTVHPAFTHIARPGRFATDEAPSRTACCSARQSAGCSNAKRAGCFRRDHEARGVAQLVGRSGPKHAVRRHSRDRSGRRGDQGARSQGDRRRAIRVSLSLGGSSYSHLACRSD